LPGTVLVQQRRRDNDLCAAVCGECLDGFAARYILARRSESSKDVQLAIVGKDGYRSGVGQLADELLCQREAIAVELRVPRLIHDGSHGNVHALEWPEQPD